MQVMFSLHSYYASVNISDNCVYKVNYIACIYFSTSVPLFLSVEQTKSLSLVGKRFK